MSPRLAPLTLALSLVLALAWRARARTRGSTRHPSAAAELTASWQQGPDAPFPGSLAGEVGGARLRRGHRLDHAAQRPLHRPARRLPAEHDRPGPVADRRRQRPAPLRAREQRRRPARSGSPRSRSAPRATRWAARSGSAPAALRGRAARHRGRRGADSPDPSAPPGLQPRLPQRRCRRPAPAGPGFWNPRRSANGINDDYRRALDKVLDDWQATDPDGVFVAGDLVDGRWGRDSKGTGNFGPVGTLPQQQRALRPGSRHLLPAVAEAVPQHGLDVFPAVGDHEYGDNPWPAAKRVLVPRFRERFADYFTRKPQRQAEVPRPPEGTARVHGVRRPAAARRPGDHPRPLRHHPRAGPDRSRPGPARLAAQGAPQGPARPGAVDHRPGPRADPRAGAHPRLERPAPHRRRQLRRSGSCSRSTASTSTSPARPTT